MSWGVTSGKVHALEIDETITNLYLPDTATTEELNSLYTAKNALYVLAKNLRYTAGIYPYYSVGAYGHTNPEHKYREGYVEDTVTVTIRGYRE